MNQESNKIKSFTDLKAWQEAHQLVIIVYEITKDFPKEELFGLTNQMKRCSVSISSNIAEGFSRQSYKEKVQFYSMALGSLTELQNQILITKDIGFIMKDKFTKITEQTITVNKILNGLIKKSKSIRDS